MKGSTEIKQETVKTPSLFRKLGITGKNIFATGNEAISIGALLAGCEFFSGYPITPSSEILTKMAYNLPKFNGKFYQTEDEIAAIGMAVSTSMCGKKAMTATSGPGMSLMQEDLGWAIINEIPVVIVNVMRVGPSTGQPTKPASADIDCMVNGRHGDAGDSIIILSPTSVQECFDLTIKAFNLSEKYRMPVILAVDGYISHLSENLVLPEEINIIKRHSNLNEPPFGSNGNIPNFIPVGSGTGVAYSGLTHDEWGNRKSFDPKVCYDLIDHFQKKKALISQDNSFLKKYQTTDCEYLIISYGLASRASKETVSELRKKQTKIGLLSFEMIWPINESFLDEFPDVKKIIVVENNTGQLTKLLGRYVPMEKLVTFKKWWGEPIKTHELLEFCENIISPSKKTRSSNTPKKPTEQENPVNSSDITIKVKNEFPFCLGCGHRKFTSLFLPILEKHGLNKENTILVCGIGCAGIVATTLNGDVIKTSHGRTLNAARAVQMAHPNHTVIVISGDGDLLNIGGNHLIHTARDGQKFPILCICLDNKTYGMTGGQPSCTTPSTAITSIPFSQNDFDLKGLLYDGCKIDFFACTSVIKSKHFTKVLEKALNHIKTKKSFAFVHVLGLCISHFAKKNPGFLADSKLDKSYKIWDRGANK